MSIIRTALALAAGTVAAHSVSDRHKTAVGVTVALAVYWARIGADPGEPTWPWEAGDGGRAAPGKGDAPDGSALDTDARPVIDVVVPVHVVRGGRRRT